ncbi:hypothetical protein NPIL_44401 [Nephila pilipes]|uniref:Uncharacterized protein n=1 Tax=Nephila pilipes TaxID=299642 RepID=A0A8X6INN6_NEPPI|nr:hypothetical protein NPIL_44401 [Nephila pilipes]
MAAPGCIGYKHRCITSVVRLQLTLLYSRSLAIASHRAHVHPFLKSSSLIGLFILFSPGFGPLSVHFMFCRFYVITSSAWGHSDVACENGDRPGYSCCFCRLNDDEDMFVNSSHRGRNGIAVNEAPYKKEGHNL